MSDKKPAPPRESPPQGPKGAKVVHIRGATFFIRPEVRETFERMERSIRASSDTGKIKAT